MADDATASAAVTRPQKPDEAAFKQRQAQLEKEHKQIMDQYNAIKQKIDLATPNKNSDNPTQKRRAELIAQLNEIKQKQGAGKNNRNAAQDQIKRLDEQLRAKKNELKASRDLVEAKNEEELDRKIQDLEQQVERGNLSLVEEKKTLERIGKMKRSRKQFTVINKQQEDVDALQAKIQETKAGMSNPESKALSEQYSKLQAELDAIKAEQDEAYKSLSSLRDERTRLQGLQKDKWNEKRKMEDEYHMGRKAFQKYERDQKQKAWERSRAERERIEKERKMERAQKILAEASDPAYLDEIRRANSLLHFFDPSHVSEKAPLQANKGLGAQPNRKVDESSAPTGMKIVSKKERDEELFPAATGKKKGGKGKKANAATKPASSFNCPPAVLEDCAAMGIDPPMSAEEVPATIEKVKAKLDHWKSDQAAQTQRNIEKAKKEIEKLEAEEAKEKEGKKSSSSSGDATPTTSAASGDATETKSDDQAVEEVTNDVAEKATLDEKKAEVAAA